jgi:D-amino-acid dehydrogenase
VRPASRPQLELGRRRQQAFDAVVVCAGVQANAVLASVGLKLPLAPVHGYSVTAPIRHVDGYPDPGPAHGLMDERYKVAISRLGQRVRVAGSAEIGGHALTSTARRAGHAVQGAGRLVSRRCPRARGPALERRPPMLPDGPPVLGASPAPGVWLNLGHGSSGWALACGSACVLADLVSGRAAALDISAPGPGRLRTAAD